LDFLKVGLDVTTAALATGHEAICIFVNDIADAEVCVSSMYLEKPWLTPVFQVLEKLSEQRVKFITLRCAGFNNVDLKRAKELGIKVARVPAYSPESVAEFTVGMIMTVVRKYHKAYNRVREGNFLLDGEFLKARLRHNLN